MHAAIDSGPPFGAVVAPHTSRHGAISYAITTAVPLADTMSIPFCWPRTS
jgi:hypothetical protein